MFPYQYNIIQPSLTYTMAFHNEMNTNGRANSCDVTQINVVIISHVYHAMV